MSLVASTWWALGVAWAGASIILAALAGWAHAQEGEPRPDLFFLVSLAVFLFTPLLAVVFGVLYLVDHARRRLAR